MNYQTQHPHEQECLLWPTYIPPQATRLIIGTFPTEKSKRSFQFFYPNPNNPFWAYLAEAARVKLKHFDHTEKTIDERKMILQKLNMGITDMGYKILRSQNSSLDGDLFPIEYMDIFKYLDKNPSIDTLYFTSKSGSNSVAGWFKNYCQLNGNKTFKLEKKANPATGSFIHNQKQYKVIALTSTSGATRVDKELVRQMYLQQLALNHG